MTAEVFPSSSNRQHWINHVLKDLESICEEERQLNRQRKLYLLMHTWLVIHVPLSVALVVLGGVHAVVALLY